MNRNEFGQGLLVGIFIGFLVGMVFGALLMKLRLQDVLNAEQEQTAIFTMELQRANKDAKDVIDSLAPQLEKLVNIVEQQAGLKVKAIEALGGWLRGRQKNVNALQEAPRERSLPPAS